MTKIRTDWTRAEIAALFDLPFTGLLFQAAIFQRKFHPLTRYSFEPCSASAMVEPLR